MLNLDAQAPRVLENLHKLVLYGLCVIGDLLRLMAVCQHQLCILKPAVVKLEMNFRAMRYREHFFREKVGDLPLLVKRCNQVESGLCRLVF